MLFNHSHIAGRTAKVEPMIDSSYPRHGAFMSIRQDGKPFYSSVMHDMPQAVLFLRRQGYIIPAGF